MTTSNIIFKMHTKTNSLHKHVPLEVFYRIAGLKYFRKFIGKHVQLSPFQLQNFANSN